MFRYPVFTIHRKRFQFFVKSTFFYSFDSSGSYHWWNSRKCTSLTVGLCYHLVQKERFHMWKKKGNVLLFCHHF